jgi:hypothetical protein
MSIQEIWVKFKGESKSTEWLLALLIIVVAVGSFFLGRMSVGHTTQQISKDSQSASVLGNPAVSISEETNDADTPPQTTDTGKGYVASKNGTKYHLPWCSGAKRIKEENKVFFATKEEAEKAGYTPAANCKGI